MTGESSAGLAAAALRLGAPRRRHALAWVYTASLPHRLTRLTTESGTVSRRHFPVHATLAGIDCQQVQRNTEEPSVTAHTQARAAHLSWLWVLPLLLAAALAIPQLDRDAFHADESSSLIVAGALRPGPWSLAEVWSAVARRSPEQALGWPMLLSIWGRVAGWSEVAVRALTLFAGMLALAWVGRTGRDLFAPRAGLFATLLLAASAFFLLYPFLRSRLLTGGLPWHNVPLALLARRLAAATSGPGRCGQACCWQRPDCCTCTTSGRPAARHPVLGLFHLLFVPKNRRWWQPVLLFGLATLARCPANTLLFAICGCSTSRSTRGWSGLQATAVCRTGP